MPTVVEQDLRQIGLAGLQTLNHPQFGYRAAVGRFDADYFRDLAVTFKLVCSRPSNLLIPGFLPAVQKSINLAAAFQGKEFDYETQERPGSIFHEYRNGLTPPGQMIRLQRRGWPVREKAGGGLEMIYYGAADTTPRFRTTVAIMARAKETLYSPQQAAEYIHNMWRYVKASFKHDVTIADSSGYGLIDSTPLNMSTLFNQTEKDSDYSYLTEEGETPKPPYVFLSVNAHYLESLRETAEMAQMIGDSNLAQEAWERYEKGVKTFHNLFWMKDEHYYSPLIDGEGQQLKIINDDALDALWCQVVEQPYADAVIARLTQPDLNTDYGIRSRSSDSTQFRANGPRAYWNGTVWTHRQGIAAIAFENYGHLRQAAQIDKALGLLVSARGCEELVLVTADGQLQDYTERGKKVAGNPQLWAAGAVLARTAGQLSLAAYSSTMNPLT